MANERKNWRINDSNYAAEHDVRRTLKNRPIGASARIYTPAGSGLKERARLLLLECGWSYGVEEDGALLAMRVMPAIGDAEKLYHALEAVYGPEGSIHAGLMERAAEYPASAPVAKHYDDGDAPITIDDIDDFGPAEDL